MIIKEKNDLQKGSDSDNGDGRPKLACTRWIKNVFRPSIKAKALMSDGRTCLYVDDRPLGELRVDQKVEHDVDAFVLASDNVLETALILPKVDEDNISSAVALHVQSVSPFHAENTVFSWKVDESRMNACTVSIVIASKDTITETMSTIEGYKEYELWYVNEVGKVYRFSDYGGARRLSIYNKFLVLGLLLCMGIILTLGVLAITPTAQLRFRAIEAYHQYQALVDSTKLHVQKKNELIKTADVVKSIMGILSNKTDIQKFLVFLTDTLPDDTHILSLEVHDLRVKLSGTTGNSNNLMKSLGDRPEVKNLRAPVPVTRQPGSSQEGFTLEFSVAPELLSKVPVNDVATVSKIPSVNSH